MWFTSDNASGAAPQIMAALARANEGYARSYGADPIMDRVRGRIRTLFEAPEAAVYLVATGTAANALALALYSAPWTAIFAHETAHIAVDECGAPEFYTNGSKLIPVGGTHGKMTPETLAAAMGRVVPIEIAASEESCRGGLAHLTRTADERHLTVGGQVSGNQRIVEARHRDIMCGKLNGLDFGPYQNSTDTILVQGHTRSNHPKRLIV